MLTVLSKVALVLVTLGALAAPAAAQQARLGTSLGETAPATQSSTTVAVSALGPLTNSSFTPAFGALALGVSQVTPSGVSPLFGSDPIAPHYFSASVATDVYGSEFGFFAGYNGGSSLFNVAPTPGFNFGATVGYAGFYLQAGVSDNSQQQQLRLTADPKQGWLAGFGYKRGAFNVRFSYMTAQSFSAAEPDSRTWMIGGIYQLNSILRLNADAFTSPRAAALSNPTATTSAAAPQGTGAHVGLQLRF